MHWVLILSILVTSPSSGSGPYAAAAIEHVPGFGSKETCEAAGRMFLKTWGADNVRHSDDGSMAGAARYTCVQASAR